ncbi:hypothetical protein JVU11DRAFT_4036 [Chiua virens]|nr:hypothetical protein JVU11DRAFT_4036 [Chiua virens]
MLCEAEGTPDAEARAMFEVNFWGAVGVSRAAVKLFREVNSPGKGPGGMILQNNSQSGFLRTPALSFYHRRLYGRTRDRTSPGMEHQGNAVLDATHPSVCILQPSAFYTKVFPAYTAYTDATPDATRASLDGWTFDDDPYKFAETLHQLVDEVEDGKKVPLFLPIGHDTLELRG